MYLPLFPLEGVPLPTVLLVTGQSAGECVITVVSVSEDVVAFSSQLESSLSFLEGEQLVRLSLDDFTGDPNVLLQDDCLKPASLVMVEEKRACFPTLSFPVCTHSAFPLSPLAKSLVRFGSSVGDRNKNTEQETVTTNITTPG